MNTEGPSREAAFLFQAAGLKFPSLIATRAVARHRGVRMGDDKEQFKPTVAIQLASDPA
jgi:hypothetical protein